MSSKLTNHYYGDGFSDFLVLRLDDAGDVLWGKNFGLCSILTPQGCNINIEKPASLCVAEDGGPLLVGRSSPSHGSPFVWGVKLDALGGVEWQYTYFGDVEISSVRQTRDLGYIVGGSRNVREMYGTREYSDGWLIKLEKDGAFDWIGIYRGFDRTDQETIMSVQQTADDGYVASGSTTSLTPGEEDFWVLKLDESGLIPECAGMTTWDGGPPEETAEQGANTSITAVETDTVVTATEVITQDTCLSGVSDLIDLARTGQTTAYHVGDDGHIRAGAPWPSPRFADNGDGTGLAQGCQLPGHRILGRRHGQCRWFQCGSGCLRVCRIRLSKSHRRLARTQHQRNRKLNQCSSGGQCRLAQRTGIHRRGRQLVLVIQHP